MIAKLIRYAAIFLAVYFVYVWFTAGGAEPPPNGNNGGGANGNNGGNNTGGANGDAGGKGRNGWKGEVGSEYPLLLDDCFAVLKSANIKRHFTLWEISTETAGALANKHKGEILADFENAGFKVTHVWLINAEGKYIEMPTNAFFAAISDLRLSITGDHKAEFAAHIRNKTGKEFYAINYIKT